MLAFQRQTFNAILLCFFLFYVLVFVLLAPYVCFQICSSVLITEWQIIEKIAAPSAYDMFSWNKYLIVDLVFPTSVFVFRIFTDCAFS